ncbi:Glu/Leu/Phe/Val dehydrogenase [Patescibacteria group bacterium]|nr:Glu/Leu/Phe/Val dehydrogenase [Patescibacteria group bacterium]MBU4162352.1 Glu/Leu/Phe/Val dehydrogenase [Patescibacteria group bacterium]
MNTDNLKPEYVITVTDSNIGMEGYLVIDNTLLGPGKGGIRMTPEVTLEEVARLARVMTWKNALAGIPFGGAKAGIKWNGGPDELKKQFIESFAKKIKMFIPNLYIAGPDVNTGEKEMKWFIEATGIFKSATGKPITCCEGVGCGIPHEVGSTGFGVAQATKVAASILGIDIKGATVSIHGFGNVGTFVYKFLTEMGAKIIAIADKDTVLYSQDGFEHNLINEIIDKKQGLIDYAGKAERLSHEKFWKIPVDIMIPASVTDVIHKGNKDDIRTKMIIEGANIPMTEEIEEELGQRGILVVPDFVANAGGVISSYSEHAGHSIEEMFESVREKITNITQSVCESCLKYKHNPRKVALSIAQERLKQCNKEL